MADQMQMNVPPTSAPVTAVPPPGESMSSPANSNNEITEAASGQSCPAAAMGIWVPTDQMKTASPFVDLFRPRKPMVDLLDENMRLIGFNVENPIVGWREKDVVVDGHTRLLAAKAAGLKQVLVVYRSFADENAALDYAIACQRHRRNLTDAEILKCVRELDKRRGPANQHTAVRNVADSTGDRRKKSSAAATAAKLGVSQRKAEMARTVADRASAEVKAAVESEDMTISAAYKATMAARRAADPEPQSAPMSAELPALPTDPQASNAGRDTAQASDNPIGVGQVETATAEAASTVPSAAPKCTGETVAAPTAADILRLVVNLAKLKPTTPAQAFLDDLRDEVGRQYPALIDEVKNVFGPQVNRPKKLLI